MAHTALSVTAPTGTTYDSENPTQGTEELNMTLHAILQDMEDAGNWWLKDNYPSGNEIAYFLTYTTAVYDTVFDYAASAIEDFRDEDPIGLSIPVWSTIEAPVGHVSDFMLEMSYNTYKEGMKYLFLIYYLWKTETDPLRLKDYIRDMLLAWPLQDIAINLKDEGGSDLRVYPQWNNLET